MNKILSLPKKHNSTAALKIKDSNLTNKINQKQAGKKDSPANPPKSDKKIDSV